MNLVNEHAGILADSKTLTALDGSDCSFFGMCDNSSTDDSSSSSLGGFGGFCGGSIFGFGR